MANLAQLQSMMEQAMRHKQNLENATHLVKKTKPMSNEDRLNIYHNSITSIFINTLKSTYPVCQKIVGREFFSAMSFQYVQKTESHSPDLNDYGHNYPQFIAEFEHAQALPYLSDVAQLEWYWHRLSLSTPSQRINLQPIAQLNEQQLAQVIFHPPKDAFLFNSNYPIHEIWHANSADVDQNSFVAIDSATPMPEQNTSTSIAFSEPTPTQEIDINSGAVNLILLRDQSGLRMDQLPDNLYFLLQQFAQTRPFGEVANDYVSHAYDESFEQAFSTCCQQGWIAGLINI